MATRFLTLILAAAACAFTACSGDDATPSPTATPTTAASASPSSPSASPSAPPMTTGTATASGSSTPGTSTSGANLSPLAKVDRFRYAVTLSFAPTSGGNATPNPDQSGSLTLNGAYIAPDRSSLDLSLDSSELPFAIQTVQIGDVLYTKLGDKWQQSDASQGNLVSSFLPTNQAFYDEFALDDMAALGDYTLEERNGVTVKHFALDKEALGRIAQEAGRRGAARELLQSDDLHMDLYVDDAENYLVGLVFTGVTKTNPLEAVLGGTPTADTNIQFEMKLDLTDIGDPSIAIEAPI